MSIADEILIDDEFASFNDALAQYEREQLIANVRADGKFTDPLIVWNRDGDWVLIDGHNRFTIWRDVFGCDPKWEPNVVVMRFKSRDEVLLWIDAHQRGRRNDIPAARALKALKLKPVLGRLARANMSAGGGDQKSGLADLPNPIGEPVHVRDEMAERADVSSRTMAKVETVATKGSADLQAAMKKGDVSIDAAAKAAELSAGKQAEVVAATKRARKPRKAAAEKVAELTPMESLRRSTRLQPGDGQCPRESVEQKPKDTDSRNLRELKLAWRNAGKRDRKVFLAFVDPRQSLAKPRNETAKLRAAVESLQRIGDQSSFHRDEQALRLAIGEVAAAVDSILAAESPAAEAGQCADGG